MRTPDTAVTIMKPFKWNNSVSLSFKVKNWSMLLFTNNPGMGNLIKLVYSVEEIRQSIMGDLFKFPPANKWNENFKTNKIMHFTNSTERERETEKPRCHWHWPRKIYRLSNYLSRFLHLGLLPGRLHPLPPPVLPRPRTKSRDLQSEQAHVWNDTMKGHQGIKDSRCYMSFLLGSHFSLPAFPTLPVTCQKVKCALIDNKPISFTGWA